MKKLYIDFDETLFDHASFVAFVAEYLQSKGRRTKQFTDSFDEYHDIQDEKGLLRLYRHRDHIQDKLGMAWDDYSAEMYKQVQLHNADFCYPEVHEFLDSLHTHTDSSVSLLTYGDTEYQTYKTQLCPHIAALPIVIVAEPKGEFLAREHNDIHGVLLDDKAPLELPNTWQHIWVNRAKKRVDGHGAHKTVYSLNPDVLTGTHIN